MMRLIQQIAAMVAALIKKKKLEDLPMVMMELEVAAMQHVGLGLHAAKDMTPQELDEYLNQSPGSRHLRGAMLAELLIQDAAIEELQGDPMRAMVDYTHAFCLLFDAMSVLPPEEQRQYQQKMDDLASRLKDQPHDPYVSPKLDAYLARRQSAGSAAP